MPDIALPYPHPGQQIVLEQMARHTVLCAGRRWFKTTLGAMVAVEKCVTEGERVLWCAPTDDQCSIGFDECVQMAAGYGRAIQKPHRRIEFPNGGLIFFRSMNDPENARGHTADGVVMDEAATIRPVAWYEIIQPMLLTTRGWSLFLGTPNGKNWFYREFQDALTRPGWAAFQAPLIGARIQPMEDGTTELWRDPHELENSTIDFEDVKDLFRRTSEKAFRQEILAEFLEDGGLVFSGIRAVSIASVRDHPESGHQYTMGIDWGRAQDRTVVSVLDSTTMTQVALYRLEAIDYQSQIARILAWNEIWKPYLILAELNAMGDPNVTLLNRHGVPVSGYTMSNKSKVDLVDPFAVAVERREITLLDDDTQLQEFEEYEAQRLPGGLTRYSHPEGGHDDHVIATMLAHFAARKWDLGFLEDGLTKEERSKEEEDRDWRRLMSKLGASSVQE